MIHSRAISLDIKCIWYISYRSRRTSRQIRVATINTPINIPPTIHHLIPDPDVSVGVGCFHDYGVKLSEVGVRGRQKTRLEGVEIASEQYSFVGGF